MTDIVERLREGFYGAEAIQLQAEAADEIDRLRTDLAQRDRELELALRQLELSHD